LVELKKIFQLFFPHDFLASSPKPFATSINPTNYPSYIQHIKWHLDHPEVAVEEATVVAEDLVEDVEELEVRLHEVAQEVCKVLSQLKSF
jgi:hypothetical protein